MTSIPWTIVTPAKAGVHILRIALFDFDRPLGNRARLLQSQKETGFLVAVQSPASQVRLWQGC